MWLCHNDNGRLLDDRGGTDGRYCFTTSGPHATIGCPWS